jgi:hypothetical protein
MALIEVILAQVVINFHDSYFIIATKFFIQYDLILLDFGFPSFTHHFIHFIILNLVNYFNYLPVQHFLFFAF